MTTPLSIDLIMVEPGRRGIREEEIQRLAESMETMGLKTPISVRRRGTGYSLIAGAHRLAAARLLGWKELDCIVMEVENDDHARLWEIAENLHRAELTVLERSEHIAEWIRLGAPRQGGQVAQAVAKHGHSQEESGISKAARKLGVDRTQIRRAVKIASLTPEAKRAATETGLDNNQSALLKAAKLAPEAQVKRMSKTGDKYISEQEARLGPIANAPVAVPDELKKQLLVRERRYELGRFNIKIAGFAT